MNIGCLLFILGIASQNPCAPLPVPYQVGYIDAEGNVRAEVHQAIGFANEILGSAGSAYRLVSRRWDSKGELGANEIAVYLITQPGMSATYRIGLNRLKEEIADFRLENFVMDSAYENCSDADDCVENLYKGSNISDLVIGTLDDIANSHVAVADGAFDCRCILVPANDLRRFNVVFGKAWGPFLLGARWSGEEISANPNIPEILFEKNGIPLRWFLPSVLLHEVGHHDGKFRRPSLPSPSEEILKEYESTLNSAKAEERRANAFAAIMMRQGCFSPNVSTEAKKSCVASDSMSMIIFGIDYVGKEQERSLRHILRLEHEISQLPSEKHH